MNPPRCRQAILALILGLLIVALPEGGVRSPRPLTILVTNDDGFDSPGLTVMQAALVKAGHEVTVVASATNMSASSMSMTSGFAHCYVTLTLLDGDVSVGAATAGAKITARLFKLALPR